MNTEIRNFTERQYVSVFSDASPSLGPLMYIFQHDGCTSFTFAMTTVQAHSMAAALIAEADSLDASISVPVFSEVKE